MYIFMVYMPCCGPTMAPDIAQCDMSKSPCGSTMPPPPQTGGKSPSQHLAERCLTSPPWQGKDIKDQKGSGQDHWDFAQLAPLKHEMPRVNLTAI